MKKYIKYKNDYVVSNCGEVWKITKNGLKICKQSKENQGYKRIYINGAYVKVHRIVMEAFNGPSELTVDHLDRNKENNHLNNLEYVTQNENNKRANSKRVKWNDNVYRSSTELSVILGLSRSACAMSIKNKYKLKGHYAKYI
ncbi:HTH DNA binding protein [Lactococcus phage GE1]|uniref:Putative HNH endonuclease n=1 Tax=Lactococcus phage GE1 TaxID=1698369 RepID=A0A0N9BAT1_9CAUD|nr:HTH DNA binding protein [Lactococcus phage GE1]ALA06967.1 putative HNH endonuclease [Lactococcus phage GE1]